MSKPSWTLFSRTTRAVLSEKPSALGPQMVISTAISPPLPLSRLNLFTRPHKHICNYYPAPASKLQKTF